MSARNGSEAEAFYESASAYCALVESLASGRPSNLYAKLEAALSQLAFDAKRLPAGTPDLDEDETQERSHDDRVALARKVHGIVHEDCAELTAVHNKDKESATRVFMLWDDLADIYEDLKEGMTLFSTGTERALGEAMWQWRFTFEAHWGEHLYSAQLSVHEMRYMMHKE